jgi:hypothetical protein
MKKEILVTLLSGILVLVMLSSGCSRTALSTTSGPSSATPLSSTTSITPDLPVAASPPSTFTPSSHPTSPEITTGQTPSPSAIPTPPESNMNLGDGGFANLDISKAPAVGETVDLTYTLKIGESWSKPVTKIQLEFERYDPAVYYPLGKGQSDKDWKLGILAKAKTDSGLYFYLSQAAKDQPDTIVPEKSVVVSGETKWEGTPLKPGNQTDLAARVSFPEEGEWVINAVLQTDDGASNILGDIYLTVNKDSGIMGWPKGSYGGAAGYVDAHPGAPVGIYLKTVNAPLMNEKMPLDITIYSIEDIKQASVYLGFMKMDGYKYTYPSPDEIISEGKYKWEGSLKIGTPTQFSCSIKFPSEGDWSIYFMTRASPESLETNMLSLPIHIDKEKSRFGWTLDHNNPNIINPLSVKPESTRPDQKKTQFHETNSQTKDATFVFGGFIEYTNRVNGWSKARYCWVDFLDPSFCRVD